MKNINRTSWIVFISFFLYMLIESYYFNKFYNNLNENINYPILSYLIVYMIVGLPIFIGVSQLANKEHFFDNIGIKGNFKEGFLFGLLTTLPMIIAYSVYFPANREFSFNNFFHLMISVFFYEVFFRGFFFQQIYNNTKLGFLAIALSNLVIIITVRLLSYQWNSFTSYEDLLLILFLDIINILTFSFLEISFFAWLYAEWNFNLWIVIFARFFTDLSGKVFILTENISTYTVIYKISFSIISFFIMIIFTYLHHSKKNIPFEINKKNIWIR